MPQKCENGKIVEKGENRESGENGENGDDGGIRANVEIWENRGSTKNPKDSPL